MFNRGEAPVKVVCKRCGRESNSTEFTLDPFYKMLVCATCVRDRKLQANKPKEEPKKEPPKPAGWDEEDEYLERAAAAKAKETAVAQKIDDVFVIYKCKRCGYQFKHNTVENRPKTCGYCGTPVGKFVAL